MNKVHLIFLRYRLLIAALVLMAPLVSAQVPPELKTKGTGGSEEVVTLKLDSKLMGREMPYRVIIPADYKGGSRARYGVVYLLHGLTGHYNNWTDRTRLAEYALTHRFIIVTPEGDNGWYTDSVSVANDKYESYIVKELVPEIDKIYRTMANRENRMLAGLSMGGYGALKFGLKYPEMFSLAGSFSGALGAATLPTQARGGGALNSIGSVFGAEDSETRKANDIFRMIRELTHEKVKQMPFLYIDCGTEDFLLQNNRDFIALLIEKKIPHEYRQLPGGHNWPYWDRQVQEFLRLAERTKGAK